MIKRLALVTAMLVIVSACGGDNAFDVDSTDRSGASGSTDTEAPPPTDTEAPPPTDTSTSSSSTSTSSTSTSSTSTSSTSTSTTTTTLVVVPLTMDEVITLTIDDLVLYWTANMPDVYGIGYEDVSATIPYFPSSGDVPPCGPEPIPSEAYVDNAFYCRPDDYVAWDAEGLFPDLWNEFGDFTIAFVLAHEWGHAIQARGAVFGPTIMTELQADCFSGAWAAEVDAGRSQLLRLDPGDLEEAMAGFVLFRDPPGTSPNDPGAHGSAFDRFNAFQDGFFNGASRCETYEDGNFAVVDIPMTQQDLETGGDLPLADTAPLLGEALETWWGVAFPELFGTDYVRLTSWGGYRPSSGDLPACGPGTPDPADYENNAFYCPDGDFVAWDDEGLFPDLHGSIGDFAVGIVMAHEWATAVQARAGLPIEGIGAELQADCFTGAWAAALVPLDNPTGIVLSPGDLDEAISGFLLFGDDPVTGESFGGTAFQRFDAFQTGFFGGASTCLDL